MSNPKLNAFNKLFPNFIIGTLGWDHSSWQGRFYPEDLPKEWQLDYYSNFSRLIVVPESIWLQGLPQEKQDAEDRAGDWLENFADCLLEESIVYFELTADCVERPNVKAFLSAPPKWLRGVLIHFERPSLNIDEFDGVVEAFRGISDSIGLQVSARFCTSDMPEEELQKIQALLTQQAIWFANIEGECCFGAPLFWIENLPEDGRAQANLLKSLPQKLPAGIVGAPIVIKADHVPMNAVQNAKVVCELLGL